MEDVYLKYALEALGRGKEGRDEIFNKIQVIVDAKNRVTPVYVTDLKDNEIFVFGSNIEGKHQARASEQAKEYFGAIEGQGEGLQGSSYALPTTKIVDDKTEPLNLEEIKKAVERLLNVVQKMPEKKFLITRVGCGYSNYKDEAIAPMFKEFVEYNNVYLPERFLDKIFGIQKEPIQPHQLVPTKSEEISTFYSILDNQLMQYIKWLTVNKEILGLKGPRLLDKVERTSSFILSAVNQYMRGLPAAAYKEIAKVFDDSEDKKREKTLDFNEMLCEEDKDQIFFRMREEKENWLKKDIDEKGLFHIPFSLRGIVKTQRYSVPGYPCLYLGKHISGCWEELGRPNLSDCLVSKLKNQDSFKILDLSMPSQKFEKGFKGLENKLLLFPFVIACTMRTSDNKATFKPEYIIPQLLLQFVKERAYKDNKGKKIEDKAVYGIKYTSVHYEEGNPKCFSRESYDNYVIPVFDISHEYCHRLGKLFKISKPICIEYERIELPATSNEPKESKNLFDYLETKLEEPSIILCQK